jgi:hypothetical protein
MHKLFLFFNGVGSGFEPATRSNISCAEFPKSLKMLSFPCDNRVNGYLTANIVLQNGQKICHVVCQETFARWTGEAAEYASFAHQTHILENGEPR